MMEVGQIRPGMIVEIPQDLVVQYAADIRPTHGVFAGADLAKTGVVFPIIRALVGEDLISVAPRSVPLAAKWRIFTRPKLVNEIREGIRAAKLRVPPKSIVSGSDPEMFVMGKAGVIPAWKFLHDKKLATSMDYQEPFWDGFQAEFCPEARECLQQHVDGIRRHLVRLLAKAQKIDPKARITSDNTIQVPDSVMKEASDEEVRFRCTPSLNVYRDGGNPTPQPREYKFRFAGGHIHAGFGSKKFTTPVVSEIIRALDGILGIAGVSLAANFDTPERRKMYGRAGEFRLPNHGIEYRVLSNFWVGHPAVAHLVLEVFRGAIKFAESGLYNICWEKPSDEEIREIINECDVVRARKILVDNVACLQGILKEKLFKGREYYGSTFMSADVLPSAIKAICNGIESVVKDPGDVHKNWHLEDGEPWRDLCMSKGASWASVL